MNNWNDIKYALWTSPIRNLKAGRITEGMYDFAQQVNMFIVLTCVYLASTITRWIALISALLGVCLYFYYHNQPSKGLDTKRTLTQDERDAVDRAFWESVQVVDDGFEELTQEQLNALSLDEAADYTKKLADRIVREQDELDHTWIDGLPANRQGPFAVPYDSLTPEQQAAVDRHYLKLKAKITEIK